MKNNVNSALASVLLIFLNSCLYSSAIPAPPAESLPVLEPAKCVTVRNAQFGEYLHAGSPNVPADPFGSRVFTWMRKEDGPASNWGKTLGEQFKYQGIWNLKKGNCDSCYTIKSAFFKDDVPTKVYNSQIEIVPGFPNRRRIKINVGEQQQFHYIYASSVSSENRRYVFIWGPNDDENVGILEGARDWIIENADCPSYVV